jgi:hypothetical protein
VLIALLGLNWSYHLAASPSFMEQTCHASPCLTIFMQDLGDLDHRFLPMSGPYFLQEASANELIDSFSTGFPFAVQPLINSLQTSQLA